MENYHEDKMIGEGSFGRVFQATRLSDQVTVALKKVPKLGRSEREIKSLRQECEIQKNLNHPNIIQMLDSFETSEFVIIVTEYAGAGELSKLLVNRQQGLPVQEVQRIACDLVSALNYLHSRRILHRDMKPQNILIGSDGLYKLCDFGFAKTMLIGTYVLMSMKGTPLYMAPEIIFEHPYDHNADLWSLGCILYELLVGKPPFFTTSLLTLVNMIRYENIFFPEFLVGPCRSFLMGLLEKNPLKRLTWPNLLTHPFVSNGLRIENITGEFSLTKALSPSQELAKETQRQNLQRKLTGYSKKLIKTAKKFEEAQKLYNKCGNDGNIQFVKSPMASPSGNEQVKLPKISPVAHHNYEIVNQNAKQITSMMKNMKIEQLKRETTCEENSSSSSCETLTSSSDSDNESDDGGNTVIIGNTKLEPVENSVPQDASDNKFYKDGVFDTSWKSGAMFTLHSLGSEDKPIQSEEWVYFLIKTMKEVVDNPKCLCEKHFLTVIVAPLRNHLSGPEVVEKIAKLLTIPFILEDELHISQPGLMLAVQTIYLESKVLPNLLYSCNLTVRRRLVEGSSYELDEVASLLTAEDLEAIDKCMRLVSFLVYKDKDFVAQFCDSVCVLHLNTLLQLFLKLDKRKSRVATETLCIICHLMRIIPSNGSIVEELLLESTKNQEEFWRILQHTNPSIKSRAIRILSYLSVSSEKTREKIIANNSSRLWKLLTDASLSKNAIVRDAVGFALHNIKYLSPQSSKVPDECHTSSQTKTLNQAQYNKGSR